MACRERHHLKHYLCLCFCSCIFHPFHCCFYTSKQRCLTGDGMIPKFKDKQITGESALPGPVAQLDAFGNYLCGRRMRFLYCR